MLGSCGWALGTCVADTEPALCKTLLQITVEASQAQSSPFFQGSTSDHLQVPAAGH